MEHITVLKQELVDALKVKPDGIYVDCTGGGGGHAKLVAEQLSDEGKLIVLDRDPYAITLLQQLFAPFGEKVQVNHCAFSQVSSVLEDYAGQVDGIFADIGVSNFQLADGARGFSFRHDGPLDMRMDTSKDQTTAADVVNSWSEENLTTIFREYGEEKFAKGIAKRIVFCRQQDGDITTTKQLADIVAAAIPKKFHGKTNPATKVFQALRIEVNGELDELKTLLAHGYELLKDGGRLVVISFHSLEDRLVKSTFKSWAGKGAGASDQPWAKLPLTEAQRGKHIDIRGKIVRPFPVVPSAAEIADNPKSRSAKMRTVEKLAQH